MHDVDDALEYVPGPQMLENDDRPEALQIFPGAQSKHKACATCG